MELLAILKCQISLKSLNEHLDASIY
jgi:hypothetical protein